ncbi:MAG: segregation/condensation protein A [Halobacteriaceae archaeon]
MIEIKSQPKEDEIEPVELLVQMAKKGDINPWDIDIVEVTEQFLNHLDEQDLRSSGRALFYASVLLRMKSDALVSSTADASDETAETQPTSWEVTQSENDIYTNGDPIDALENEIDRRLERKSARGTPETLDELIRELREAERKSRWKESRSYNTSDSPTGFRRGVQEVHYHSDDISRQSNEPTVEEVTGTAHSEDIEETINQVQSALQDHYDQGREAVLFQEIANVSETPVATYLAVLFLSHRGQVNLEQDSLFDDLWIHSLRAQTASD